MPIDITGNSGKPLVLAGPAAVTKPPVLLADGPGFRLAPAPHGAPKAQIEAGQ